MRDGELGMVYYNWRYFDTKYGRWNSRDHHETYANSCLYCYYKNNPLYYTDYLGLWFTKRHRYLTKNSIRQIELKDTNRKYKLSNIAYMKLENGNINTDSDEATKNQQKYHFCSHFENEQPADEAIENYKEALKGKIGEFNDSIKNHNPSEEKLHKSLRVSRTNYTYVARLLWTWNGERIYG